MTLQHVECIPVQFLALLTHFKHCEVNQPEIRGRSMVERGELILGRWWVEGGRVGGKLLLSLCPQSSLIMHGRKHRVDIKLFFQRRSKVYTFYGPIKVFVSASPSCHRLQNYFKPLDTPV